MIPHLSTDDNELDVDDDPSKKVHFKDREWSVGSVVNDKTLTRWIKILRSAGVSRGYVRIDTSIIKCVHQKARKHWCFFYLVCLSTNNPFIPLIREVLVSTKYSIRCLLSFRFQGITVPNPLRNVLSAHFARVAAVSRDPLREHAFLGKTVAVKSDPIVVPAPSLCKDRESRARTRNRYDSQVFEAQHECYSSIHRIVVHSLQRRTPPSPKLQNPPLLCCFSTAPARSRAKTDYIVDPL